ncbi:iron uptake transporter deferrochelatase/peroxidase subunit [Longispora albida]|uniref:iron uptake transporter deferrochelatase/peroxidase subunit n=1 Tax=Longispora albida TaxID=203523 RepID=UPI00037FF992|nr:iron uptake transporter deferrochelatase/peroxidase subunit [Longispora albida]
MTDEASKGGTSRRALLGAGAAGVAGVAAGVAGAQFLGETKPAAAGPSIDQAVPFYGEHQAGIVTPAQDRLHFAAFDVTTKKREDVIWLLKEWTKAAARMTAGRDAGPLGATGGRGEAPPDDTGEALGLPASGLTLTIGFGPGMFAEGRFGLAGRKPAALEDIPHLPGDAIDAAISGGDICVQACAYDPQVAVHAIRNLARIGFGKVTMRWSQLGFGRTSSTSREQETPRNLMGFKDGTRNLKAEDKAVSTQLWAQPGDGQAWMAGGSYVVTRKIRMHIETWDRTSLDEQEQIMGRHKGNGAPLGQKEEFDEPDLKKEDIAVEAHIRLAHPDSHGGAMLLRRGYNYVDGSDKLGRLDAGLFFIAYQRDPRKQFVPIQRALGQKDVLNEYIKHVSSAVFACPPGVKDDKGYWGEGLFA